MDVCNSTVFKGLIAAILLLVCAQTAWSNDAADIVQRAESLKQDLIELNRELYEFEEELLHPANTQIALFLSIDPKSSFLLDSVELQLNNEIITTHLYRERELEALKKGGIQRLYLGSLADGVHKLNVRFNGQGSNSRYYRRNKALKFTKDDSAKFIQLIVGDGGRGREPVFRVKQW